MNTSIVDYETLINMFNSENPQDVNLAEGIFVNFSDEEIQKFMEWGWKQGYSRLYHPSVIINERLWKKLKLSNKV